MSIEEYDYGIKKNVTKKLKDDDHYLFSYRKYLMSFYLIEIIIYTKMKILYKLS